MATIENLVVWNKSVLFAKDVYKLCGDNIYLKNNFGLIVAGFDFSQPFTFYVSHQWSVANILSYVKPLASWIYLYPKS